VDHQFLIDMLPAYALDCLDAEERTQVRQHLETCVNCQAELRTYQGVVAQLTSSVPQRTPPLLLKQRILAQVARQPASRPVKLDLNKPAWWTRLTQVFLPSTPALGWVTVLVILILVAGNLILWQKLSQAQSSPGQDFRTVELVGTTIAPGAGGILLISADERFGTLLVDGMPTLKENQVFQLWLIKEGKRTSGGIFSVKYNGYGTLAVKPDQSLLDYNACDITIEPTGGSSAPTGAKVLGGNL
jgi:anti-sigma-K factor RskA